MQGYHRPMAEISVPRTDRWTHRSELNGAQYRMTLSLPHRGGGGALPLVVLLDGETMILTATEFVRAQNATMPGLVAPVAFLSVMADTAPGLDYVAARFRDFTPAPWTLPGPFAGDNALAALGTGGADGFLDTIINGIIPEAAQRVDIDMSRLGVCGWSLSGLFAAHAWVSRPDVFSDLVAISPSLWWNDASMLSRPISARPAGHRAVVTAGEHEEGDVSRVWPAAFANAEQRVVAAMVSNAARFGGLARAAGAQTHTVVFRDEHHMTLVPASLARAIVLLHGAP